MEDEEPTTPYQFEVPVSLHARVMAKAQRTGVKIAPLMRMALEEFLIRPVHESIRILEKHNKTKRRKRNGRR